MNYKFAKIILILVMLFSFITTATAYNVQFSDNSKSTPLRWQNKKIPVSFSRSLLNQNSISKEEVLKAINSSLETWENAADIRFIENWSDENSVSPLGKNGDSINLVTISQTSENLLLFNGDASDNAARTRVFFNRKGNITESDIVLNPYTRFSTDGSIGTYDFEAVLTHELGHLLGLEHSDALGSTMFANQGKNGIYNLKSFAPRTLSADDISGIRSLYGTTSVLNDCCGSISGKILVTGKSQAKKFKVFLEDTKTNAFIAEVFTDNDGNFNFDGLSAGDYNLFSKSLVANLSVEKIGTVTVLPNEKTAFNSKLKLQQKNFEMQFIGFNGQIANLAVPLNSGKSYTVYVAGKNLDSANLSASVNSSLIKVNPKSLMNHDYGSDISVLSFEVLLDSNLSNGEYSISLTDKKGNSDYLFGSLSVDEMQNPWFSYIF